MGDKYIVLHSALLTDIKQFGADLVVGKAADPHGYWIVILEMAKV
jgi:hypothetical protein